MRRHLMKSIKEDIPDWLSQSLLCWYSPIRQGCTNENMAENPILRDLSGNGFDLECQSFAWEESSGIGADGKLYFDGIDDICFTRNKFPDMTGLTIVYKRNRMSSGTFACHMQNGYMHGYFILDRGSADSFFFKKEYRIQGGPYNDEYTISATPENIRVYEIGLRHEINDDLNTGVPTDTFSIGGLRPGSELMKGNMTCFLMFDRILSDVEIDYIVKNIID